MEIFTYIAVLIVASFVAYALAPKPEAPKPAALNDFDLPTAEEGRAIPVIFGTVWITGPNVIWYGDLASQPITGNWRDIRSSSRFWCPAPACSIWRSPLRATSGPPASRS